jgi:hypothetical protein
VVVTIMTWRHQPVVVPETVAQRVKAAKLEQLAAQLVKAAKLAKLLDRVVLLRVILSA